jgi:hypothetical protein
VSAVLGDNFHLVGNSVQKTLVVGIGAGDLAMRRLVIYTLDAHDRVGAGAVWAVLIPFGRRGEVVV